MWICQDKLMTFNKTKNKNNLKLQKISIKKTLKV